jgi:hypothetical protein
VSHSVDEVSKHGNDCYFLNENGEKESEIPCHQKLYTICEMKESMKKMCPRANAKNRNKKY